MSFDRALNNKFTNFGKKFPPSANFSHLDRILELAIFMTVSILMCVVFAGLGGSCLSCLLLTWRSDWTS